MDRPPRVVLWAGGIRYPEGTACARRVQLLARGLNEHGARAVVLCSEPAGIPGEPEEPAASGSVHGVPWWRSSGMRRPARGRWRRAVRDLGGILRGLAWVRREYGADRLDAVYLYALPVRATWRYLVVREALRRAGVPLVVDVCELPEPSWAGRFGVVLRDGSPLAGVAGAVVISTALERWVGAPAASLPVRLVTALAELDEEPGGSLAPEPCAGGVRSSPEQPRAAGTVVFAASEGWVEDALFVAAAMRTVWASAPGTRLVVTGLRGDARVAAAVTEACGGRSASAPVELCPYLERADLLRLYRAAAVLVTPLHANAASEARFPTKLAEYLAQGGAVVTSAVGDVGALLTDGESVLFAEPGDEASYGRAILRLLEEPELAARLRAGGRRAAEALFDYRLATAGLTGFIRSASLPRQ